MEHYLNLNLIYYNSLDIIYYLIKLYHHPIEILCFIGPEIPVDSGFLFLGVEMNNRVIFFIDGFNLYHALDVNLNYHKYKWLDLSKLASLFLTRREKV
jgi:hypothetical protein